MVQEEVKKAIFEICRIVGVDPAIAMAVSHVESSHGAHLKSPTGALGVFQMTSMAMKDLHLEMATPGKEIIGVCAGICFLFLLIGRHKDELTVLQKYCDPKDRPWYPAKVLGLAEKYRKEIIDKYCGG